MLAKRFMRIVIAAGAMLLTAGSSYAVERGTKPPTTGKMKVKPLQMLPMMGDVESHSGAMRDIGAKQRRDRGVRRGKNKGAVP